jgi:uncharacterized membrane protein YphA (DoxX/SURF4 family)
MKIVNTIIRIVLGLLLLVFGLNKFIGFLPNFDFGDNVGAANLFSAFIDSGYMLPLIGGVETIVGLLLVIKKAVPAALLAMLPISVGIILFHGVLDPANIAPGALVAILNVYLIAKNWSHYSHLVK